MSSTTEEKRQDRLPILTKANCRQWFNQAKTTLEAKDIEHVLTTTREVYAFTRNGGLPDPIKSRAFKKDDANARLILLRGLDDKHLKKAQAYVRKHRHDSSDSENKPRSKSRNNKGKRHDSSDSEEISTSTSSEESSEDDKKKKKKKKKDKKVRFKSKSSSKPDKEKKGHAHTAVSDSDTTDTDDFPEYGFGAVEAGASSDVDEEVLGFITAAKNCGRYPEINELCAQAKEAREAKESTQSGGVIPTATGPGLSTL